MENLTHGLRIQGIKKGTYYIYEVEAPSGYYLQNQKGYTTIGTKGVVDCGKVTISAGATATIEIENVKTINIKGYVWVEVPKGKQNEYDNVYTDGESKLQNVIVELRNKKDDTIVKDFDKKDITAITDSDGNYTLKNVDYYKLLSGDYYISFNYSGTNVKAMNYTGTIEATSGSPVKYDNSNSTSKYKKFIPVAFSWEEKGSKVLYETVPEKDSNLTGVVSTYIGKNETTETQKAKEKEYGLSAEKISGFDKIKPSTEENALILPNINLGIKQIPDTEFAVSEDIQEVIVKINDYTYKYEYGSKGEPKLTGTNTPTVNWQAKNNIAAYTRAIYPSDIIYSMDESNQKRLEVYVKYVIHIANTTTYDIKELYTEKSLEVTELKNTFDSNRYDLADDNWNKPEASEQEGEAVTTYKNTTNTFGSIKGGSYATTTITFKVKQERLGELLNSDGKVESFPTEAIATGSHHYTRYDYEWDNAKPNEPQNNDHETESKVKTDKAPYLNLNVGETRKITGTVFKDAKDSEMSSDGEILGDGIYDTSKGDKALKGVTVDLLNKDGSYAQLYTTTNKNGVNATITTDEKGEFTLEGMIPGDYYLRYTYVGGKDGEGKKQEVFYYKSDGTKEIVTDDYKSTIVTSTAAKNALKDTSTPDIKWRWYKSYIEGQGEEKANYSVAVDNLTHRAGYNKGEETSIYAETAQISITVENTAEDSINMLEVTDNGQTVGQNWEFKGFNFGIIERPKQKATIEKVISNVRLINSQNNVIFNGNPNTNGLRGVSDLSAVTSELGSTFTRIEISENEIYGSTLEIVYTIRVTNISDVNYYGRNYYWFGDDRTTDREVTLSIDEVNDYLDTDLVYLTETESVGTCVATLTNNIYTDEDTRETYQVVELKDLGEIYTNKKTSRDPNNTEEPTFIDVNLTAQRRLSSNDDDMEFTNKAKIITMINANKPEKPGPDDPNESIKEPDEEPSTPEAKVTITPPTGDDKQSVITYTIIGIVAFVVLSTGIVIIKKKIL